MYFPFFILPPQSLVDHLILLEELFLVRYSKQLSKPLGIYQLEQCSLGILVKIPQCSVEIKKEIFVILHPGRYYLQ